MKPAYALLFAVLFFNTTLLLAQTDKEATKRLVDSKSFVFHARRANPLSESSLTQIMGANVSNMLNLSNDRYSVRLAKDSVIAHLPYFGRSFNAPSNVNDTGINFTSTDFGYSVAKKKKSWVISIDPRDIQNNHRLILRVDQSGSATLHVTSNNRQSISFDGYIKD